MKHLSELGQYFPYCLTLVDVFAPGRPCVYANEAFTQNTGFAPEDALGKNMNFLQGEGTSQKTVAFMRECFANKHACVQDILNYRKDGTPFINRLLMVPLTSHDTGQTIYAGVQNDLTNLKGITTASFTGELDRVKDSEIRHVVNNPLTIVIGKLSQKMANPATTAEDLDHTLIELARHFERINQFAINTEKLSNFENFPG